MGVETVLAAAAPSIIGGLLGGSKAATSTGTQNQNITKEPWAPAQDWMKQNIADTQKLQQYYQQNPFNPQQQTAMQNQYGDVDNFRQNVLPGLLQMANKGATSTYQRQRGGAPGSGAGYGGPVQPGGLIAGGPGPFTAPTGGLFGQVNFDAQNPYKQVK